MELSKYTDWAKSELASWDTWFAAQPPLSSGQGVTVLPQVPAASAAVSAPYLDSNANHIPPPLPQFTTSPLPVGKGGPVVPQSQDATFASQSPNVVQGCACQSGASCGQQGVPVAPQYAQAPMVPQYMVAPQPSNHPTHLPPGVKEAASIDIGKFPNTNSLKDWKTRMLMSVRSA